MLYFIRGVDFTLSDKAPSDGIIYPEIAFSADQKVKLVDQRPPCASYKFPAVCVFMPSLLKSNLQKAIRRRHIEEAFVTAKHFLAQDASELLRRLPIIMCEDTLLHPELFMEIVWLMAAVSKGYTLCAADCQRVIDFVGACLLAPARYNILAGAKDARTDMSDPLQLAFLLRIAYGGMKCDEAFLERLLERVTVAELSRTAEHLRADHESIGDFDAKRHLLPEAIDFHCFPSMLTETGVSKQAIWYNRSAYNVRSFTGLLAAEGAERERCGAAEWPLSETDTAAIEDFIERCTTGLRGRPPSGPKEKQVRLTGFVRRGGKV